MKEYICRQLIFTSFLWLTCCAFAQESKLPFLEQDSPKYEIRAVWLTTIGGIDWPHSYHSSSQKKELCEMLDSLKKVGINTVLLQTRVRGTTIYPSSMEPWDGCFSGTPGKAPAFDPLRFAIDECHRRGMQLHAWVVTIPVGKWNKLGCSQLRKKYPNLIKKIGDEGYMNPESPQTADYLARFCHEIVENYDVDGIHLDYIRYPETWKMRTSKSQGRANITNIVTTINNRIKACKPWVMLSCATIGKHDDLSRYHSNGWNARTTVCQDAQQWLRDGIVDALYPMMYFRDNQFFPFAIDWQEQACGRLVVPGLGIYFLDPHEGRWRLDDVKRQLNVIRQLGLGQCFFRTKFLVDNIKDIYKLEKQFNATPALIPPMTWLSNERPTMPIVKGVNGNGRLEWNVSTANHSSRCVYNVYASRDYPVDINNPKNLIATRLTENSLTVGRQSTYNYAVTAQDRYGNESMPAQLQLRPTPGLPSVATAMPIVDKVLPLPKSSVIDADYIAVETLQGQRVAYFLYSDTVLHVAHLPEGCYQWRAIGKKKRQHRLGFFTIKRQKPCPSSK
jgi:uncharacterized lipoprotein YddW (UPF0748 family)